MQAIRLIVAADEPALFFASVQDAESFIEAVDVEAGVYLVAFGPAGEPHTIRSEDGLVRISETGEAQQPNALKAVLLSYLKSVGEVPAAELDLSELLQLCRLSYR